MEEYFSPDEVRAFLSRCESDRQRIMLFLFYNYGLTIEEAIAVKAGHFMAKPDYVLFNFTREATGKTHTYKIQNENYRMLYRVIKVLQNHETLIHKDRNLPISHAMAKKDLFDLAVIVNRKITHGQLFDSHLYWLFRRGVSYSQAVEEYGIPLSGRHFKVWEQALLAGRIWPNPLD